MNTLVTAGMRTLAISTLAIGCGIIQGPRGEDGSSCSVTNKPGSAVIVCDDGTRAEIPAGSAGPAGPPGEPGLAGANALLASRAATPGECEHGGVHIDHGSDLDGDDVLDPQEVGGSADVCNGADGLTSLIAISDEPEGENCPAGGKRLDFGVDDDANGVLDLTEIDGTSYLCNDAPECGVQDSSFQMSGVWSASGGGSVSPGTTGVDLGEGILAVGSTSATENAALTQAITCTVPSDNPALTLFGRVETSGSTSPFDGRFSALLNGMPVESNTPDALRSGPTNIFVPVTYCIGETLAQESITEVRLNAEADRVSPGSQLRYHVDMVELTSVSPDECPLPGSVTNGDFEAGTTGWSANGALLIEDDGSGNNQALHMEYAPGCVGPSGNIVSGRISIPSATSMPKPAVRLRIRGDASGTNESFSGRIEYAGTLTNFATWPAPLPTQLTVQTHCLPQAARGQAGRIVFALPINCGDGFRELWVDDISIVNEPTCP